MVFVQFLAALIVFDLLKHYRVKIMESAFVFKLKKKLRLFKK